MDTCWHEEGTCASQGSQLNSDGSKLALGLGRKQQS